MLFKNEASYYGKMILYQFAEIYRGSVAFRLSDNDSHCLKMEFES